MALRPATEASEASSGGDGGPDKEGNTHGRMRSRPLGPRNQKPKPMVGHPKSEFSYDKSFLSEGKKTPKIPDRLLPATADKTTSSTKGKRAPPNLVVNTARPTGGAPEPITPSTPISPLVLLTWGDSARTRRMPKSPAQRKPFPAPTAPNGTDNAQRGSPGNHSHTGTYRDHKPEPIPIPKRGTVTWAENTQEKIGTMKLAKTPNPTKEQMSPDQQTRHKTSQQISSDQQTSHKTRRKPVPALTLAELDALPKPQAPPKNAPVSQMTITLIQQANASRDHDKQPGAKGSTGNKSWSLKLGSKGKVKVAAPTVERGRPADAAAAKGASKPRSRSANVFKTVGKSFLGFMSS